MDKPITSYYELKQERNYFNHLETDILQMYTDAKLICLFGHY